MSLRKRVALGVYGIKLWQKKGVRKRVPMMSPRSSKTYLKELALKERSQRSKRGRDRAQLRFGLRPQSSAKLKECMKAPRGKSRKRKREMTPCLDLTLLIIGNSKLLGACLTLRRKRRRKKRSDLNIFTALTISQPKITKRRSIKDANSKRKRKSLGGCWENMFNLDLKMSLLCIRLELLRMLRKTLETNLWNLTTIWKKC